MVAYRVHSLSLFRDKIVFVSFYKARILAISNVLVSYLRCKSSRYLSYRWKSFLRKSINVYHKLVLLLWVELLLVNVPGLYWLLYTPTSSRRRSSIHTVLGVSEQYDWREASKNTLEEKSVEAA
jgi:hypothetical protein